MNLISIASKGYFGLEAGGYPAPVFILPPELASSVIITDLSGIILKPKLGGAESITKPSTRAQKLDPQIDIEQLKPKMKVDE